MKQGGNATCLLISQVWFSYGFNLYYQSPVNWLLQLQDGSHGGGSALR